MWIFLFQIMEHMYYNKWPFPLVVRNDELTVNSISVQVGISNFALWDEHDLERFCDNIADKTQFSSLFKVSFISTLAF